MTQSPALFHTVAAALEICWLILDIKVRVYFPLLNRFWLWPGLIFYLWTLNIHF